MTMQGVAHTHCHLIAAVSEKLLRNSEKVLLLYAFAPYESKVKISNGLCLLSTPVLKLSKKLQRF